MAQKVDRHQLHEHQGMPRATSGQKGLHFSLEVIQLCTGGKA
jgi:hypothetical protein